jgi:hypothetical protein
MDTVPLVCKDDDDNDDDDNNNNIITIIIIIIIIVVSPLCRVSTLIFLRQTMSLGNTVLQLF